MFEALKDIEESITNISASIKRNTNSYGDYPNPGIDPNISRLEKLLIIKNAMEKMMGIDKTVESGPDEISLTAPNLFEEDATHQENVDESETGDMNAEPS